MPQTASMALSLSFSKFASTHSRGEEASRRAVSATSSSRAPARRQRSYARLAKTASASRATRKCAARPAQRRRQCPPAVRVGGAQRCDPLRIRLGILFDAEPAAVGKCARETMLRRHEVQPLRDQPVFVRGEKRRTREQAQIHRVEIVAKPGTGNSRVLTAPPATSARSTTATFQPLAADARPQPVRCGLPRSRLRRRAFAHPAALAAAATALVPAKAGTSALHAAPGLTRSAESARISLPLNDNLQSICFISRMIR